MVRYSLSEWARKYRGAFRIDSLFDLVKIEYETGSFKWSDNLIIFCGPMCSPKAVPKFVSGLAVSAGDF